MASEKEAAIAAAAAPPTADAPTIISAGRDVGRVKAVYIWISPNLAKAGSTLGGGGGDGGVVVNLFGNAS